ncbi:MAG: Dabb family protein [Gemmataceae bacterium]
MRMRWVMAAGLAVLLAGAVTVLSLSRTEAAEEKGAGKKLVHNVFFTLAESSDANRKKLTAACKKYLTKHPGEVYFAAGPVASEFDRPVNVRDFDVALTIVFKDKAAHDKYQDAPRHLKFIEENKDLWKSVRVFDSYTD